VALISVPYGCACCEIQEGEMRGGKRILGKGMSGGAIAVGGASVWITTFTVAVPLLE
jgi:hypothetical protein